MMVRFTSALTILLVSTVSEARNLKGKKKGKKGKKNPVQIGPRPYYMVDSMKEGPLKDMLSECADKKMSFESSDWSIGHRGACMQYPEHTLESYKAALVQGAGIIECDVTFTKDKELICRHAQCDLHTTTDVVTRPDLNAKCTVPYTPGGSPTCCASDFTLAEIKTLCAKMDAKDASASDAAGYIGGVAPFRTTMYSYECPEVPTHAESIALVQEYDAKFTPELKTPQVAMPYQGTYTQEDYAQQMIDEYIAAGVDPMDVWPQSFLWSDAIYWVENTDYKQAVALEGTYSAYSLGESDFADHVKDIVAAGVPYLAPPMWMLLQNDGSKMMASTYAEYAKNAGFDIITWTLERSGPLVTGGGWYYQTVTPLISSDGDQFELLYALQNEVGITGIFSDWPATTTFYANCMGL